MDDLASTVAVDAQPIHPSHFVQFYETDAFLCDAVAEYLILGLRAGEPCAVIATEAHRDGLAQQLRARGLDVARAEADHRLVMLDARRTLDACMEGDHPHPERFREVVGGVLASISSATSAQRIRAFGEMVDLLWRDGRSEDALKLEELWNDLATRHSFSLLCAYGLDAFSSRRSVPAICATHGHVLPPEPVAPRAAEQECALDLVSLVTEIARRMQIERVLRASLLAQREAMGALRRAEADARDREEALSHFLETAVVPIHTIDGDGLITWANQAELDLLGYARDEYVGQPIARFHVDAPVHEEMIRRLLAGDVVHDHEARMRAKDGTIRHVLVSSRGDLRDSELVSTRCFSRDITERKHAEQERDRLIEELMRTVHLNEMFTSVLAHDLRNPLNTILLAGQTLMGRADDTIGARALQRLTRSVARMQGMLDQLLDFSRARINGGISLDRKLADAGVIARDVAEEVRGAYPEAAIELCADGDLRGELDVDRIAQVLSNLVGNAIQHGRGDVPVALRLEGVSPDAITITIANGGTISAELLPLLFAPFRGAHQRGPRSQGLGLSLYLSDQIVRAHGGTLAAWSRDDRTELTVVLPRRAAWSGARSAFAARPAAAAELHQRRHVGSATDDSLRMLIRSIRDYAIFMLDPAGYVMSWNTGAELINGYSADEIIGQHFSLFYPREERRSGKCERELAIAERTGHYEEQGWRLRKDGTPFWANVLITAVRDPGGELVGFAKVTRDLTEERLAKEAQRQSEERFRLLVEGVAEYAIFLLDPEGHVSTWNSGAERINGYRASEIIGKHFSAFSTEEDLRAGKAETELEIATRDGRFEDEGWRIRKDGSRLWANVVLTALHDASAKLIGFAMVTRDLTERRKHEDDRIRLAQAQEAVRLRDEFLSIASHELKTPLTVLRMQLETLRKRFARTDPSIATQLDRTHRASQRLTELVETLLDASRIATGQLELRRETFDLATLVREVVDRMGEGSSAARCTVTCHLAEGICGTWDRSRVDQVLTNLLANAFKYAAGTAIEVSAHGGPGIALLEVRDHGPGLPPGREAALFHRFERAASIQHYGGLGLGLYVVDQIARAHGGDAIAANAPGGGARFRIELPLHPQSKAMNV
ncbi:MAG TPA: PAS domain S-box protein [Kofleriaceae bacterium]|nr:PAS domain S-box protein [Kofleriaceae bacterium]